MPFLFDVPQQQQITTLFQAGDANSSVFGAFSPMYSYLNGVLSTGSPPPNSDPVIKKPQLWFSGAVQANSGTGAFAIVIRDYTQTQQRLHFGRPAPGGVVTGGLQAASNAVALNVYDDIRTGNNGQRPVWSLPTIDGIAANDGRAVADTLFNIPGSSAAFPRNAGWAGTVLHSLLGDDQTWRLIGTLPTPTPTADTYDDYRNLLFAQMSYYQALTNAFA